MKNQVDSIYTYIHESQKGRMCNSKFKKKRYLSYFKFKALTHQLLHVSIFCSQVLKIFTGCKANKKCACSRYVKVTMAGIHTYYYISKHCIRMYYKNTIMYLHPLLFDRGTCRLLLICDWLGNVCSSSTLKVVCSYTTTELLGLPL